MRNIFKVVYVCIVAGLLISAVGKFYGIPRLIDFGSVIVCVLGFPLACIFALIGLYLVYDAFRKRGRLKGDKR